MDLGWAMGPCFEGGLSRCYNGFIKMPNEGPILGDHRIYIGSQAQASEVSFL